MNTQKIGIDIGSTTAKIVVLSHDGDIIYSRYERHQAAVYPLIYTFLEEVSALTGDTPCTISITGSVGMGVAERCGLPFVQEVVAATKFVTELYPSIRSIIDIGGEDAKVVFLHKDRPVDLRMNGNCAGGTGAFIDQMAVLLGTSVDDMSNLALRAQTVYPIASRCGVFSKTDVQNLLAKNVSKEDVAASVFHAVAVQTITTLSRGCDISLPILFCGGPLTFIPALRKAFVDYLRLSDGDWVVPGQSHLIPAWGAALSAEDGRSLTAKELLEEWKGNQAQKINILTHRLDPLFPNEDSYTQWRNEKSLSSMRYARWEPGIQEAYLGIDSGSTTTKIILLNSDKEILFTHYVSNNGNPILAVKEGLISLQNQCASNSVILHITGSCVTGYGEELIKAAFGLDEGIIETVAHYMAARQLNERVSFILDIGGQDMKAIFVDKGILTRMELNEACSSGCGSFIETFSRTLGHEVSEFARLACLADSPCDLGTRCTVFMNSKVKQVLREGASVGDIAAGLAYSVVKNCLHKVLKINDFSSFGDCIVVQGGTMRNDAVVRAFEKMSGHTVFRSDRPELMGAYGCALYAQSRNPSFRGMTPDTLIQGAVYTTRQMSCHGCTNQCLIHRYDFTGGNTYYSGNKCEKVFSNKGESSKKGTNAYPEKNKLLFDRLSGNLNGPTIGIPRCLNMYENYPFWHTLFTKAGMNVILSSPSDYKAYERAAKWVMSDNICFPAKVVHSHLLNLCEQQVDRIFFPYVVYERLSDKTRVNSYNCPIVSGYSEIAKSVMPLSIPIDTPVITFKDEKALFRQCCSYLKGLGITEKNIKEAFATALQAQREYEKSVTDYMQSILRENISRKRLTVLLAGRPYHSDMLIQHKISDMIASMGVDVITDDIVRGEHTMPQESRFISQWAYPNRILAAARWAAEQDDNVQFIQLTSFGCGPDAFLVDEVKELLHRHGKSHTLLKIDDVNNIGSIRLRVRSVIESLKMKHGPKPEVLPFITTPPYTSDDVRRKIIVPFFTPFISPLIPDLFRLVGYDVDVLPMSDRIAADYGLQYANNEVCYPATLVVGDIIKAFKEGRYEPSKTAVAMTQTGGQCRATGYIALIKKALVDAGYADVPVVSVSWGDAFDNPQPGFRVNWLKILPIALAAVLFSDCIAKFYYTAVAREKEEGAAAFWRDYYLDKARQAIRQNKPSELLALTREAADRFTSITDVDKQVPKVGIVVAIFLKFHAFAQKNISSWLVDQHIEVVPPTLTEFFLQSFVNKQVNQDNYLEAKKIPDFVLHRVYALVRRQVEKYNRAASHFPLFQPFPDIFETSRYGKEILPLYAQFGEGWLLPAEIVSMAHHGVDHVVSLQPFGCIANHIVSKGVEKKIKTIYPQMNLLSLDFDSGVSDVNVINRMLLFIHGLNG